MYFVTVAGSAVIVMVAAFVLNSMLDEGWFSREHQERTDVPGGPELGHTQARCNEAEG